MQQPTRRRTFRTASLPGEVIVSSAYTDHIPRQAAMRCIMMPTTMLHHSPISQPRSPQTHNSHLQTMPSTLILLGAGTRSSRVVHPYPRMLGQDHRLRRCAKAAISIESFPRSYSSKCSLVLTSVKKKRLGTLTNVLGLHLRSLRSIWSQQRLPRLAWRNRSSGKSTILANILRYSALWTLHDPKYHLRIK